MVYSRPPIEVVEEALEYRNGQLFWKVRPITHFRTPKGAGTFNGQYPGKRAGTLLAPLTAYRIVWLTVKGQKFQILEHTIIWALHTGEWVDGIDHKDGDGLNNTFENLEASSHTRNMHNKRMYTTNKSGCCGVSWYAPRNVWVAQGSHNSTKKTLGYSADFFEACCLRKSWEIGKNFSARHGR